MICATRAGASALDVEMKFKTPLGSPACIVESLSSGFAKANIFATDLLEKLHDNSMRPRALF